MGDMADKSNTQLAAASAEDSGLLLEDSLSYGRCKGFITYEGEDFLVSATSFFCM